MANEHEGGGASRSTEPAYGSSTGTDVSLREYINVRIDALDRHLTYELASLRREASAAHNNSERAIEVAAQESKEMQDQAVHFATRESQDALKDRLATSIEDSRLALSFRLAKLENWQAKIVGGMGVIAVIGIANLVKVWTG